MGLKSDLAKKKCDRCFKITPILIRHDICSYEQMCLKCLKSHREKLAKQIKKLSEAMPIVAPLGYSFIYKNYFVSESMGRLFVNEIWDKQVGFHS